MYYTILDSYSSAEIHTIYIERLPALDLPFQILSAEIHTGSLLSLNPSLYKSYSSYVYHSLILVNIITFIVLVLVLVLVTGTAAFEFIIAGTLVVIIIVIVIVIDIAVVVLSTALIRVTSYFDPITTTASPPQFVTSPRYPRLRAYARLFLRLVLRNSSMAQPCGNRLK